MELRTCLQTKKGVSGNWAVQDTDRSHSCFVSSFHSNIFLWSQHRYSIHFPLKRFIISSCPSISVWLTVSTWSLFSDIESKANKSNQIHYDDMCPRLEEILEVSLVKEFDATLKSVGDW